MPGFNGRGPLNEGPLTGRRRGHCTENNTSDFETGYGAGFGRGAGGHGGRWPRGGYGFGNGHAHRAPFQQADNRFNSPETAARPSDGLQTGLDRQLTHVLEQLSELLKQVTGGKEQHNAQE